MLRALLILLAMAACGCVLDRGGDRRPEILPGRYRAENGEIAAVYDFREDGSFTFERTESGRPTITETGRWEYRYVGPEERYLVESDVTRRDLGSDSVWHERTGLQYSYRIEASDSGEFHLNPGTGDMPGFLVILSLLGGSNHVVFHRQ